MRRREFISLFGGAMAMWPRGAHAQQPMPVIGFLNGGSVASWGPFVATFRKSLAEWGFAEGKNIIIEFRWAEGQAGRLPALATELVDRQVTLIVAAGGDHAVLAAKGASITTPIVFISGSDPVKLGLVASLSRPGGKLTGITQFTAALEPKRLEILREAVPHAALIALLVNPDYPASEFQVNEIEMAARAVGQKIMISRANSESSIDAVFADLVENRASALLVASDPFFTTQRDKLVALSARHALPTIYQWREFAAIGGLMSYGTDLTESYRLVASYVGKMLKGARAEDLPVQQSTKVELVVNLKTAKNLGLTFPNSLLGRADEVIE